MKKVLHRTRSLFQKFQICTYEHSRILKTVRISWIWILNFEFKEQSGLFLLPHEERHASTQGTHAPIQIARLWARWWRTIIWQKLNYLSAISSESSSMSEDRTIYATHVWVTSLKNSGETGLDRRLLLQYLGTLVICHHYHSWFPQHAWHEINPHSMKTQPVCHAHWRWGRRSEQQEKQQTWDMPDLKSGRPIVADTSISNRWIDGSYFYLE